MLRSFSLAHHTLDIKKTLARLKDNILTKKKEECFEDDISLIAIENQGILSARPKVLNQY